jgi:hypothetical protein
MNKQGRTTAQADSRQLPVVAARVQSQAGSFMVDKVALGLVISEYFGFPCQFSFHQMLHIHPSSGAGTIGQLLADVSTGLRLTALHEAKK